MRTQERKKLAEIISATVDTGKKIVTFHRLLFLAETLTGSTERAALERLREELQHNPLFYDTNSARQHNSREITQATEALTTYLAFKEDTPPRTEKPIISAEVFDPFQKGDLLLVSYTSLQRWSPIVKGLAVGFYLGRETDARMRQVTHSITRTTRSQQTYRISFVYDQKDNIWFSQLGRNINLQRVERLKTWEELETLLH
ncbi:MAG TPA: hypothetical protein VJB87_01815 [Candidatus Nanoarchaeia archaeon]|nr:hypothetical protein [Candidatus Nanoarchaeia archaeon]